MNIDENLEILQNSCRACSQKADINIWNFKVKLNQDDGDNFNVDDTMDLSVLHMMEIFNNKNEILELPEEFPFLCWQCLEDLKFCYVFYEKLKLANIKLKKFYNETINQCIEEEHLLEPIEGYEENQDVFALIEASMDDSTYKVPKVKCLNITTQNMEEVQATLSPKDTTKIHTINEPLEKNSAFAITQFVPSTLGKKQTNLANLHKLREGEKECQSPPQHFLTMDYKIVEVKDLENIESPIIATNDNAESVVYICQHCPQAFAKSEYLKTHIQKCHVCIFCTQSFSITDDLYKHIRTDHKDHKCVICLKNLSSNTNLRHHIRRVHRVNLPAKVVLIDYSKSKDTGLENEENVNEIEIIQDDTEETSFNENMQYLWKTDDFIDDLSDNNVQMK